MSNELTVTGMVRYLNQTLMAHPEEVHRFLEQRIIDRFSGLDILNGMLHEAGSREFIDVEYHMVQGFDEPRIKRFVRQEKSVDGR